MQRCIHVFCTMALSAHGFRFAMPWSKLRVPRNPLCSQLLYTVPCIADALPREHAYPQITRAAGGRTHRSARARALLRALCALLRALCALLRALCALLRALCALLRALCALLRALCALTVVPRPDETCSSHECSEKKAGQSEHDVREGCLRSREDSFATASAHPEKDIAPLRYIDEATLKKSLFLYSAFALYRYSAIYIDIALYRLCTPLRRACKAYETTLNTETKSVWQRLC